MAAFGGQYKTVQTGTITLDGSGDGTDTLGTSVSAVDKAWVEMNPGFAQTAAVASAISIYLSATNTVTVTGGANWANTIISYVAFEIF